ncbi:MAG: peptidoglycan DD-metalloendopeptidase family protein [Vicinamibacterales bacterium]
MNKVTELIDRMRVAAGVGDRPGQPDREQVKQLAAQFESMLLVQMLRDMRQSGRWDDESPESGGLGAETFFETLDVELSNYLTRAKGFGLSEQLQQAIEKSAAGRKPVPDVGEATPAPEPVGTTGPTTRVNSAESPESSGPLRFAVAPGSITSSFGWRQDPFTGKARFHRGIDVRAAYGQDVQAAGGGRVVFSGTQRGYGNTVLVEHANGVQTRYAHLSATIVQTGDVVEVGQVVGRAGRSGRATGTHLHFEVLKDGRQVPPAEAGLTSTAVE